MLDIGEPTTKEVFTTRVYDVMPSNPVFSHYMGSLTTPPCTEVRFSSSKSRILVSVEFAAPERVGTSGDGGLGVLTEARYFAA